MSCASSSKPPRPAEPRWRGARWLLGTYRLGMLAAAFQCLHLSTARRNAEKNQGFDSALALPQVRAFLPTATSIGPPEGDDRVSPVLDQRGELAGWAAQTHPESKDITGYAGPSNLLIVFDLKRRVAGTALLESADTAGHVAKVRADAAFSSQWNGRHQAALGQPGQPVLVSGASLTSEAMARGVAARFGAEDMQEWFPGEVPLTEVLPWFPAAASVSGNRVLSTDGTHLGTVLRSSRMGVAARGFQGASDVLVALDPADRIIAGVALRGSRDNEPYIGDVRDTLRYDGPYAGMTAQAVVAAETGTTVLVSGASRTAEAVEETVREMLRRHLASVQETKRQPDRREWAAFAWIALGLFVGLGPLRGRKVVRYVFAAASVLVGGLWLGLLIGQDQWIKWAVRGTAAGWALPLVALTAAALLIPAAFGKNVYCSQLCPHGAAQMLLGNLRPRRFALPARLHRAFSKLPWITLGVLWLLAFLGIGFPFADAEPFEVWSVGFIALVPVLIFAAGLLASVFLPQAYCHYGCPTGAVLKFLASSPGRWTRRDLVAGAVVALGWFVFLIR